MTMIAAPAGLWRRWFVVVTVGECVGFSFPAVVGAMTTAAPNAIQIPALVVAGAVEGSILGAAQAHVLRRVVPGLPVGRFVAATAVGAAFAYAVAMLPVALGDRLDVLTWPVVAALAVVLSACLLASIGTAQCIVLRPLKPRSGFWVPATGASWAVGLGAFLLVAMPLWHDGQPVATIIGIGLLGGLAMAATVAALSGVAVLRLVLRQER